MGTWLLADLFLAVERDYLINRKHSLRNIQASWKKHLAPAFGQLVAELLSTDEIEAYIVRRQEAGAASATINRELALLKRAYKLGLRSKKIASQPYIPCLREDNVREQPFPVELYDAFARETAREGLWFRAMFELAYARGWRPKSLRELRVRNIDLARRTIRLTGQQTKNRRPCEISMTDTEYELLRVCAQGKEPDDYLLTREHDASNRVPRNGGHIVDYRLAWKRVCARVGVEPGRAGLIFYDLKRAGVTNLIDDGIDLKDAMRVTGHLTESAFRRYQQVSLEKLREVARRIERGHRERQRKSKFRQAELFDLDPERKPS